MAIENKKIEEWQLSLLATSLSRAKRLEKLRLEFHKELYSSILYPSVQLDPMLERGGDSSTEGQAIRIIYLKEKYERKIQKEYRLHVRWQNLLLGMDNHDQQILIRYFQKKKHVQPKVIRRLLFKIQSFLDKEEHRIEKERDAQAIVDFKEYQEQTRSFKREVKPPTEVNTNKQQYILNGQFVYMTPEEYANH